MKTKKPTKKEILATLKSLDCEQIMSIASRCGIDTNNMDALRNFVMLSDNSLNLCKRYDICIILYKSLFHDGDFFTYEKNYIIKSSEKRACLSK